MLLTGADNPHIIRGRKIARSAHEKEYPLLSKIAQMYSGISPGSVPVESFSAALCLC